MTKKCKNQCLSLLALLVLTLCTMFGGCKPSGGGSDVMARLPLPDIDTTKKHIACVGDSLTYSHGASNSAETGYPAELQKLVGSDYQVINYGICAMAAITKSDYPLVKEEYYKKSLQLKADTYIIMLGTNDSKPVNWNAQAYKRDYTNIIKSYLELENQPKVYIMIPPRVFEEPTYESFNIVAQVVENEVTPIIKEIGTELNIPVINLYNVTKDHFDWYAPNDNVHLNDTGYNAVAQEIYSNLVLE